MDGRSGISSAAASSSCQIAVMCNTTPRRRQLRRLWPTDFPPNFSQQRRNTVQDWRITMKITWLNAPRVARLALVLSAAIGASGASATDAPGVAFVYLGNPGDAGWTYGH